MTEISSAINMDSRLAVNPNLVLREEDDDCALLFDPDKGSVQLLNRSAVEVWKRLDGQRSLREIIESLADVFAGVDATADAQVMDLVRALADLGAIGIWTENV